MPSNTKKVPQLLKKCATKNGVCGVKVAYDNFYTIKAFCDPVKTKFIWLRRQNLIRQAISQIKANQMDIYSVQGDKGWSHKQQKWIEVPSEPTKVYHDRIREIGTLISTFNSLWYDYFAAHNIKPLTVWYEDLAAPEKTVGVVFQIHEFLGIQEPIERLHLTFNRMADAHSESVYTQFISEERV